jgi:hypothetical protein
VFACVCACVLVVNLHSAVDQLPVCASLSHNSRAGGRPRWAAAASKIHNTRVRLYSHAYYPNPPSEMRIRYLRQQDRQGRRPSGHSVSCVAWRSQVLLGAAAELMGGPGTGETEGVSCKTHHLDRGRVSKTHKDTEL